MICCQSGLSIDTISTRFNVVDIPTLSAASNAMVKFRLFSLCLRLLNGICK